MCKKRTKRARLGFAENLSPSPRFNFVIISGSLLRAFSALHGSPSNSKAELVLTRKLLMEARHDEHLITCSILARI
jgi:hypothetical protein